jgi:hypothetical protein
MSNKKSIKINGRQISMTISNFCHSQGMTIDQYKQYEANIKTTAQALFQLAKTLHKTDTGVYYSVNEILTYTGIHTIQEQFIINELKLLGMEFYNNNTEWRI